jgi:hypothetical protein
MSIIKKTIILGIDGDFSMPKMLASIYVGKAVAVQETFLGVGLPA